MVAYTKVNPKLRKASASFSHVLAPEAWKYDSKILKHYVDVNETGELTQSYKQSEEYEEKAEVTEARKRRKLNSGPMAIRENMDAAEDDEEEHPAEVVKEDFCFFLLPHCCCFAAGAGPRGADEQDDVGTADPLREVGRSPEENRRGSGREAGQTAYTIACVRLGNVGDIIVSRILCPQSQNRWPFSKSPRGSM